MNLEDVLKVGILEESVCRISPRDALRFPVLAARGIRVLWRHAKVKNGKKKDMTRVDQYKNTPTYFLNV